MDFAQSKGMKLNGSTAFTAENQFPVTLMLNGKSAPTVTASFSTDENVFKQISKELKTALKGLGTASAPQQKCINVVFKVTPETIDQSVPPGGRRCDGRLPQQPGTASDKMRRLRKGQL